MNSFKINTGDDSKQLSFNNVEVSSKDIAIGNPYNTIFRVSVVSGEFAGAANFECDFSDFKRFINEISELYNFHRTEVKIDDTCYGAFILFRLDKTGHLSVSGTLYGVGMVENLSFQFDTDQTALEEFCTSLSNASFIKTNKFSIWRLLRIKLSDMYSEKKDLKARNSIHPCPCCGCLTISNDEYVDGYICPVCFWVIDLSVNSINDKSNLNHGLTLSIAKTNYKSFGTMEKSHIKSCRKPFESEIP